MAERGVTPTIVLAASFLLGFFALDSILVVSPMLPLIKNDFALSFAEVGLLFSVPFLAFVPASFFAGALSDKLGVKKAAGIGAIFLVIGGPTRALVLDFTGLVVFTTFLGVAYAFLLPSLPKMVSGWFTAKSVGRATGIYMNGLFLGAAFGIAATMPILFPLGGSWQTVILITGVPTVISAGIWWVFAKDPPITRTKIARKKVERRSWLNRTTLTLAVILTVLNVHFYALGGWLPTFIGEKGASLETAGFIGSIPLFAAIPANFLIPWISDKIGRRKPFFLIGGIANAVGFLLLVPSPLFIEPAVAVLLGFSLASVMIMCFLVPTEAVDFESIGKASGLIVSLGFVGAVVGPYAAGLLRDWTGNFTVIFILEAILSLVIVGLALGLPETGHRVRKMLSNGNGK